MPTVTAADEALSSCSQNAAYSATIMATQIRSANAQVESGNPAMVMVRETLCTRVTATGAAGLTPDLGGYLPLGVASFIAVLPIFSDNGDRGGHIRRIQQSTLAGEHLANFCGFKTPASCMTCAGDTSRLAGRERRTHNPQRRTRLAVPISRSAGSEQIRSIHARQTTERNVVGAAVRGIDEAALKGFAIVPFDAPGTQSHAIRGATAFRHVLPRELLDAVDMPAFARAELRPCRRQIGVFPTRQLPQNLQIGPGLRAPGDLGARKTADVAWVVILAGKISHNIPGQRQTSDDASVLADRVGAARLCFFDRLR